MTAFDLSSKGCDEKRKLQGAAVLKFFAFSNYHNSNDLVNSTSGSIPFLCFVAGFELETSRFLRL
jgi:hypothetical protein